MPGVVCGDVYRFLLSPRWIGLGLLMATAAAAMVALGLWQLDRFHYRSDINARIDAASAAAPQPLARVLAAPAATSPGSVGPAPAATAGWSRVTVTGRYDPAHEILARARTVNQRVGFEVFTPLLLGDGTAVLVDRGWVAPGEGGAASAPTIPPAPVGEVTVVGRVRPPESRGSKPEPFAGRLAVRRVAPGSIAAALPYPIYGGYLTVESQTPPADPRLTVIGPQHENAAMNASYVVQWWLLAALTLAGFGYLAARSRAGHIGAAADDPARLEVVGGRPAPVDAGITGGRGESAGGPGDPGRR